MSRAWFSSVIHSEPSTAHTVLPALSLSLRVWFGPSLTAPASSSILMACLLSVSACVWHAQDASLAPWAQTVNTQDSHEQPECNAGPRPAGRLRGGGAPPVVHQGGRRAVPHPIGGQPADQGVGGPARGGAVRAPPPRPGAN